MIEHYVGSQFDDVRARERLTAGEEEALGTQRRALINSVEEHGRRKTLTAIGAVRDQAMPTRQIAEIVDVQPELAQPIGFEIRGASEIGKWNSAIR